MNTRLFIAWFEREADILAAARAVRRRGWHILDTYTPYAVHGLDRGCGLRASRLPYVCLAFALLGATAKLWFQIWTSAGDWPVNVGGKPFASVPAFVPVTFEITVLFAGLGTVLAFLLRSRLRPGAPTGLMPERVTDDRFAIVVDQRDADFDVREADRWFRSLHAVETAEHVPSDGADIERSSAAVSTSAATSDTQRRGHPVLNGALLVVAVLIVAAVYGLRARPDQRAIEVLPGMYYTVPADGYDPTTVFADGMTLREPPPGTIRHGQQTLAYAATDADALRAGDELVNPFAATDLDALRRGATAYVTFCAPCHGGGGEGDGIAAQRGAPKPPSLLADRARAMRDGQLFHIMTYGQNLMASYAAQVPADDRWRIVLHVRALQNPAVGGAR
jgi:mono/diheme cytochrome c family protein